MTLTIRGAVPADAALILRFVEALADYEKLRHEAQATEADILRDLFGASPKVFAELAFFRRPAGRLCALVLYLFHFPGPPRHLARGPLR